MKKASIASGTRDFLPSQMRSRLYVIGKIKAVFERYGYEPLETPSFEKWEVLKGKFGEEGEHLLFKIMRRGSGLDDLRTGKRSEFLVKDFDDVVDLALRYDLTVPFSRVLAMYNDLPKPFKRYQIQPVWRADRPQKGRYREFYQCDVDIAGSASMLADAEIVAIVYEALADLSFETFQIRLNHRKILNGLIDVAGGGDRFKDVCIAIDKMDKVGVEGVKAELLKRGIPSEVGDRLFGFLDQKGTPDEILHSLEGTIGQHPEGKQGLAEIRQMYEGLAGLGVEIQRVPIDLALVRGLDYYTGPIFESVVETPAIGSLSGGGRYDHLIEKFSGMAIPATGSTIGLERIIDVMEELGLLPTFRPQSQILVTIFSPETQAASLQFAQKMRAEGLRVEVYLKPHDGLQKQIKYASAKDIPLIAILGPDEAAAGHVMLRSGAKQQTLVSVSDASQTIRSLLAGLSQD